jgi:hypothetical protein
VIAGGRRSPNLASRPAIERGLFGLLPVTVTLLLIASVASRGLVAVDFRNDFWVAGARVLHGADPYAWTHPQVAAGISFPYPAPAALLFVPFALIPAGVSGALFTALCIAAVLAALAAIGVRDWRLYGLVLLWQPVVSAWQSANVTALLVLGLAGLWRYRDRPAAAGLLAALLVSLKPIVLPIGLWLIATGRYRALSFTVGFGALVNAAAWLVVGFGSIGKWLHLVSVQGSLLYAKGYGLIATSVHAGLGRDFGVAATVVIGTVTGCACLVLGRRGHERPALILALALMLIVSPQVDVHYFALLLVGIAVASPRLGLSWGLPVVLGLCPAAEAAGWEQAVWWLVLGGVLWITLSRTLIADVVRAPALRGGRGTTLPSPSVAS